jgi:hypothetical protein
VRNARWNRSILPVVVGEYGGGQPMLDAVLPADPVEEHLHILDPEPASEHLAVIGEHFMRHPMSAHRRGERLTHRPRRRPRHQRGADTKPRVIIDPGQRLQLGPIHQGDSADHIELPQLHRRPAFPTPPLLRPTPPRARRDQPVAHQRPIDPRPRRQRTQPRLRGFMDQPTRTPPRMSSPPLQHLRHHFRWHLMRTPGRAMRTIRQPL